MKNNNEKLPKNAKLTNAQRKDMGLTKNIGFGILRHASRDFGDKKKELSKNECRKFRGGEA